MIELNIEPHSRHHLNALMTGLIFWVSLLSLLPQVQAQFAVTFRCADVFNERSDYQVASALEHMRRLEHNISEISILDLGRPEQDYRSTLPERLLAQTQAILGYKIRILSRLIPYLETTESAEILTQQQNEYFRALLRSYIESFAWRTGVSHHLFAVEDNVTTKDSIFNMITEVTDQLLAAEKGQIEEWAASFRLQTQGLLNRLADFKTSRIVNSQGLGLIEQLETNRHLWDHETREASNGSGKVSIGLALLQKVFIKGSGISNVRKSMGELETTIFRVDHFGIGTPSIIVIGPYGVLKEKFPAQLKTTVFSLMEDSDTVALFMVPTANHLSPVHPTDDTFNVFATNLPKHGLFYESNYQVAPLRYSDERYPGDPTFTSIFPDLHWEK